jgi:uncharacterized protein YegL
MSYDVEGTDMSYDVEGTLWPVYVVADQSGSMSICMDELNAGIGSLHRALLAKPLTAAKMRFTLIGFSDEAKVWTHMVDFREEGALDPLNSLAGTNYRAVFDLLREVIPADVVALKGRRYAVHRPTVFFLSDGQPNDPLDWVAAHRSLTDRKVTPAAPNIIAFGIGNVREETIRQVATNPQYAFIAIPGIDIGKAVIEFFKALMHSIVASTQTFGGGEDSLIVEPPEGFRLALDVV